MHVATIGGKKEVMNLKESKERHMGGPAGSKEKGKTM